MELLIDTKADFYNARGMLVVAYNNDPLNATKGSLTKHTKQVITETQLLMDNHLCFEMDK
jgi:metal-responsive CopG/Arc/MetJ family transcriptional regulator